MNHQADNLHLTNHHSVSLLVELQTNRFLKTELTTKMKFATSWIKESLKAIDIDSQVPPVKTIYGILEAPKDLVFGGLMKKI